MSQKVRVSFECDIRDFKGTMKTVEVLYLQMTDKAKPTLTDCTTTRIEVSNSKGKWVKTNDKKKN